MEFLRVSRRLAGWFIAWEKDHDVVGIAEIQHNARPLFQHVEIEGGIAEQRHPLLQSGAIGRALAQLRLRRFELLVDPEPGKDAAITLDGVINEVSGNACAQQLSRQRLESPLKFAPYLHAETESHKDSSRQQNNACR